MPHVFRKIKGNEGNESLETDVPCPKNDDFERLEKVFWDVYYFFVRHQRASGCGYMVTAGGWTCS